MTVEMRHLRAFLAIAEDLNLTRAAARLHVTQPALSRTLAQLERHLGVRLVDRSTHHLELTEVGHRFEQRAFEAVRAVETAVASVDGHTLPLRLGHNWSAGIHLAAILTHWNATPRPCQLQFVRRDDRSAGLTSGAVDAGLTRGPVDTQRFRSVVVDRERRVAVLHRSHPLARRKSVTLGQFSNEPLVATTVGITTPELWPSGQRPPVGTEVGTVDDWLVAIASGAGFGVSVESTSRLHHHPDIRFVPLDDAPPVALLLAWPKQGFAHPALNELKRVALAACSPKETL